jgi:DNA-binding MarR family transcriptional regulator
VLALLAKNEGLLSSQLAERVQLDQARTSKAVTSLAGKKLSRCHIRPGDRRKVAVVLTESKTANCTLACRK